MGEPQRLANGGSFDDSSRQSFPKWSGVVERVGAWMAADDVSCGTPGRPDCGLDRWRHFLASLDGAGETEWVRQVNRFINRVRYLPDDGNWGTLDYWAAPDEFFARGGDCEDYAIAKYFSLKAIGFPVEQMRIVVLNDKRQGVAHAVLEVRVGDEAYILDNRHAGLLRWRDVSHYRAIYSVNEARYWVHSGEPAGTAWTQPATASAPGD